MPFPSAHNFFRLAVRMRNEEKSENAQRYYLASYKLASQVVIDGLVEPNVESKYTKKKQETEGKREKN